MNVMQGIVVTAGAAVIVVAASVGAPALDRRFELDIKRLDRNIVATEKEKRNAAPTKPDTGKPAGARKERRTVPPAGREGTTKAGSASAPGGRAERIGEVRSVWSQIVPEPQPAGPMTLGSEEYTLVLDEQRYPVLPAADSAKIIVDADMNLPPLLTNLILEKDPSFRIVSARPDGSTRFYTPMVAAGAFYSVEREYQMTFGDDPYVTIRADYRIERHSDSLVREEALLLFAGSNRHALPASLAGLIGTTGFRVVAPSRPQPAPVRNNSRIYRVPPGDPVKVADAVLRGLDLAPEAGGETAMVPGFKREGLSLSLRVDRTFAYKGRRFALAVFTDGQDAARLSQLLETHGMSVIALEPRDSFREVARKIIDALKLSATVDPPRLWPLGEVPYTIQMSGVLIRDAGTGRSTFLTDRTIDPLFRDLLARNGFSISP